ncbi:MAG: hypothetical protein RLZZ458_2296 [Planctomycetota bacterium]|jgi:hypothetical protein
MIAQTPEQLYEYNVRLKAQRDEEARGIRRGLLQGQILLLLQQQIKNQVT